MQESFMSLFEEHPLYRITHPRSIAFWGASNNPTGMGSVLLSSILALGFEGPVHPIHPKEKLVKGLPAYARIGDVPEPADLAILVLPTRVVPDVLLECAQAGIGNAIIVSAGFAEMGEEGRALQQRIVEIAREHDMRFLGPNCLGVVNTHRKLNTTFMEYDASPGFVGMGSQSGSLVTQMFGYLDEFGLGFSQAISLGNEALIDLTDCLEYLGACPRTKVIALYIEAVRRGADFVRVAREVSLKKPIVAYYVGGSPAGSRAALSHTAALAGPEGLYDGVFKQSGIVRARSVEELFDFCAVLGNLPLPRGDGTALLTHSGGPGAAAADAADRAGVGLCRFSPETEEKLREFVPPTASLANPVDLTFNRSPNDYVGAIPRILLEDPQVDALFIYLVLNFSRVRKSLEQITGDSEHAGSQAEQFIESQCEALASVAADSGKPVVAGTFCPRSELFIKELQKRGVPILPGPERAVRALGALSRYARWRRRAEGKQRAGD
jgi:acyl-CoA synthetase (NDP forming)